jgi:hypothetical protein
LEVALSYVFISHASPDKPRIKPLVDALLKAGLKVWLDNPALAGFTAGEIDQFYRIRAGGRWEDEIDDAKREAACILVCWSKHAITDGVLNGKERITWLEEAGYARAEHKLVACTVDDVSPTALPGTHSAQQLPSLDPDAPAERWNAIVKTVVADVKSKIEEWRGGSRDETAVAVAMYIQGLRSFCAKSTYTLNDSLSSDAEKLFVDIEGGLTTIEALSAQAEGNTSSLRALPLPAMLIEAAAPGVTLARELLAEIINKNGAAVLCGGAGSGKSTLLRRFALLAWDAPEKVGLATRRLPVLVRLRHLAAARGETFEQKIKQALEAANDFIPGRTIPNDFLTSWPEATNVPLLFLFDALDEAASEERGRLLTFLEQLRTRFGDVPLVLSTRDSDLVRNTSFAVAEKAAWIVIHRLASTTATSIARALLSGAELGRFLQERNRGRSFAWDTALGVRMAAAVFKRHGKLPDTRGELYDLLIRHSFGDQGDGAPQTPPILLNEEGAIHVLAAVASMNLDPFISSAPSVEACVADALQELRRDLSAVLARGGAPEVLDWMRRRGGVLTSLDPLAWSHETYREFLAARWIAQRFEPGNPGMLDLVKRAYDEPRLRSVMLFAFSMWGASPSFRQEGERSALAEIVHANFLSLVTPPKKPSRGRRRERPHRLATSAPETLFLAEILTEIRPGPTPAINSVMERLSYLHRDFIGYFDEPRDRCSGDENVVLCLRRWADHPSLAQALQPIADRYMKLLRQFGSPKSGVVHFLLVAGRKNAIQPILMSGELTDYDVAESIRGAVAAEGPNGLTVVPLALSVLNGTHPSLKPVGSRTETRFVLGSKDTFSDKRAWIAPEGHKESVSYYNAVSEAAAALCNAGFADDVMAKIAGGGTPIDIYSVCVSCKKIGNGLADRCARTTLLSIPKRAFALSVLLDREACGDLPSDGIVSVMAAAEQVPAHTRWAARLKSAYCEKLERFDEMRASNVLLTDAEPDNADAWFDLGWSFYLLDQYTDALSALEKAKSLGRDPSQVGYFKGRALYYLGRYAEAVVAFDEAAFAGNDELRMWKGRLEAKYLASWYDSVRADAEFLAIGDQEKPFVRHWRAIAFCLAGKHVEALELFAVLDAKPYLPGQTAFFRAAALIGAGAYDQAACLIDETQNVTDSWKMVLRAMLSASKGAPPPENLAEMRDRILSGNASVDALEPIFWLCAALDDVEGAKRCVQAIEAQKDARVLNVIKADLATVTTVLSRPWCADVLEDALGRVQYPKPPLLSGQEIREQATNSLSSGQKRPLKKVLHKQGMECRLISIENRDEEHTLAAELMAAYTTAKRALTMIRLGKTGHMFALCNFKFSELDPFDLKYSGSLNDYISYRVLRDRILDPFEVRQVICNDREFIAEMKKGVKTKLSVEYIFVDRLPDFGGREVIYE